MLVRRITAFVCNASVVDVHACAVLVCTAPIVDVALTRAGNLPCQHVIHLVAPRSLDEWSSRIRLVLERAEAEQLTSIAFPALGTG